MNTGQRRVRLAPALAALALCLAAPALARAQEEGRETRSAAQRRDEINHEIQLHLLATTAGPVADAAKVPPTLGGVVRQLRASLPPADYGLAATFINRVRDGGTLELKSTGGPPFTLAQSDPMTPSFIQLSLNEVKLVDDAAGQKLIQINSFRLGVKVPIVTGNVSGEKGQGYPVVQYEDAGLVTQLSVPEGEPTLVGTLNTGRPGHLFALILTVRRAGQR